MCIRDRYSTVTRKKKKNKKTNKPSQEIIQSTGQGKPDSCLDDATVEVPQERRRVARIQKNLSGATFSLPKNIITDAIVKELYP